jgi:hypothetical protein
MPGRNQSDCCVDTGVPYRSTINGIYHDSSSTDLDIRYCPIRADDDGQEDTQTKSSKPDNVHWRSPQGSSKRASQTLGINKSPQVLVSNTAPAQNGGGPSAQS